MRNADITEVMNSEEIQEIETKLCNMRCDLEEIASMLEEKECDINQEPAWTLQDIADEISKYEDYLFEYLQNR